jgi:hypothetical protein
MDWSMFGLCVLVPNYGRPLFFRLTGKFLIMHSTLNYV